MHSLLALVATARASGSMPTSLQIKSTREFQRITNRASGGRPPEPKHRRLVADFLIVCTLELDRPRRQALLKRPPLSRPFPLLPCCLPKFCSLSASCNHFSKRIELEVASQQASQAWRDPKLALKRASLSLNSARSRAKFPKRACADRATTCFAVCLAELA